MCTVIQPPAEAIDKDKDDQEAYWNRDDKSSSSMILGLLPCREIERILEMMNKT